MIDGAALRRAAASTLVAFMAVGFLPLGAFVYDTALPGNVAAPFAPYPPAAAAPDGRSCPLKLG